MNRIAGSQDFEFRSTEDVIKLGRAFIDKLAETLLIDENEPYRVSLIFEAEVLP